jgi:hypothetical protein
MILGQVGGQSEAHLNRDNTVTLVYRDHKEAIKELTYLRLLAGNPGINRIISYDVVPEMKYIPWERKYVQESNWKAKITVERLYDLDNSKLSNDDLLNFAEQCFDLLKLQFQYNIANSHFFINHKNSVVYFTDIRHWKWITEENKGDLKIALHHVLNYISNKSGVDINELSLYVEETEIEYNTYRRLYNMLFTKLTGKYLTD